MLTHARRLAGAGVVLALAMALAVGRAADVPRPISEAMVLERIEPDELTRYLHRSIQEGLKVQAPSDPTVMQLRATALLIAARAQNGRGARDLWQRLALRDNALTLQKALADRKLDAARRHAAALLDMRNGPPDARRVDLKEFLEQDDAERLLAPRRRGGFGFGPPPGSPRDSIEVKLTMLGRKQLTPAEVDAEAEQIARAASLVAAMADLVDVYAPDKKIGDKDPKDWKIWIGEMRTSAGQLEAAARAKNANLIRVAARAVAGSCNNCHSVFRE